MPLAGSNNSTFEIEGEWNRLGRLREGAIAML
jgi:hypothetical protein